MDDRYVEVECDLLEGLSCCIWEEEVVKATTGKAVVSDVKSDQ